MTDYEKILNKAARLCSSTEKCSYEISEKLAAWGLNEAETEKAVATLIKNRFLDDRRYATFFVKDKLKFNNWGKVKISYALRQKKIAPEIIDEALGTIGQEEYDALLNKLIKAKIRSVGNIQTASNKAKVMRYAAQRGFSSEDIYRSLEQLDEN
ncbi:MAG: RecX family transcriptional regulator [Bacteroidales bacterium]|nr:RecX family transcriptional regulator [Bacteroidales bacterium]